MKNMGIGNTTARDAMSPPRRRLSHLVFINFKMKGGGTWPCCRGHADAAMPPWPCQCRVATMAFNVLHEGGQQRVRTTFDSGAFHTIERQEVAKGSGLRPPSFQKVFHVYSL